MRYLVVIPGMTPREARFHDLDSDDDLVSGDELLIQDRTVRVMVAVDEPADAGYDRTLVCTPDSA